MYIYIYTLLYSASWRVANMASDCEFDEFDCEFDEFDCEFDEFDCEFDEFDCEFDEFDCEFGESLFKTCFTKLIAPSASVKKTLLLREPWPCKAAAESPLQALIWCFSS